MQLIGVHVNENDSEDTFDPEFDIDFESGYIGKDIKISDGKIFLRAERSGKSDGRIYTLIYQATDCSGNKAITSATVNVPHDMR